MHVAGADKMGFSFMLNKNGILCDSFVYVLQVFLKDEVAFSDYTEFY